MLELLILINLIRPEPLVENKILTERATARAQEIHETGHFAHYNWTRYYEGTSCKYRGENLAKDFATDEDTHNAFMNSPTHKALTLNPIYKSVGIGKYKNITVEFFCDTI